jgi:hypothetical protein
MGSIGYDLRVNCERSARVQGSQSSLASLWQRRNYARIVGDERRTIGTSFRLRMALVRAELIRFGVTFITCHLQMRWAMRVDPLLAMTYQSEE